MGHQTAFDITIGNARSCTRSSVFVFRGQHPAQCAMIMMWPTTAFLLIWLISVPQLHSGLAAAASLQASNGAHLLRSPDAPPSKVIFDHDGGIDDFITLLLLLSQRPRVELLGVIAIGADSISELALNTTLKLMDLLDASEVPVALSTLPAVNPFPLHWRWQGSRVDVLPLLNQRPPKQKPVEEPGQDFLLHLLQQQAEPVDIVATGQ